MCIITYNLNWWKKRHTTSGIANKGGSGNLNVLPRIKLSACGYGRCLQSLTGHTAGR